MSGRSPSLSNHGLTLAHNLLSRSSPSSNGCPRWLPRRSRDVLNLNLSRQEIEMADQSNNRGNLMEQRSDTNGALDGNGIARGGNGAGGRSGNNVGGDGIVREGV